MAALDPNVLIGEDPGIYTHVESARKPFVKRLFGSSKGDLWENKAALSIKEFIDSRRRDIRAELDAQATRPGGCC